MPPKVATPELTKLFNEQYQRDGNSTLLGVRNDLHDLHEKARGEDVGQLEPLLNEVEELMEMHGERCLLVDFLGRGSGTEAGPGARG